MGEFENQNDVVEMVPPAKESNVFAIISLICGILSILCCCLFKVVALMLAIAAVVLGIVSIKKLEPKKGMAIAGIVCGGVGLVLTVIAMAFGAAMLASGALDEMFPADLMEQIQEMQ